MYPCTLQFDYLIYIQSVELHNSILAWIFISIEFLIFILLVFQTHKIPAICLEMLVEWHYFHSYFFFTYFFPFKLFVVYEPFNPLQIQFSLRVIIVIHVFVLDSLYNEFHLIIIWRTWCTNYQYLLQVKYVKKEVLFGFCALNFLTIKQFLQSII